MTLVMLILMLNSNMEDMVVPLKLAMEDTVVLKGTIKLPVPPHSHSFNSKKSSI
jgi:hypothetical protein